MAGAVYLVKFRGIAESATLYFFIQDASPRCDELGLGSGRCKMTVFLSSNVVESSLYWRKQFGEFAVQAVQS